MQHSGLGFDDAMAPLGVVIIFLVWERERERSGDGVGHTATQLYKKKNGKGKR